MKFKFSASQAPDYPLGPTGPNIDTYIPGLLFLLTVYLYSLVLRREVINMECLSFFFSEGAQQSPHYGVPSGRVGLDGIRLRILHPLPRLRCCGHRHASHHGHIVRIRRGRSRSLFRHQVLSTPRRRVSF